MEGYRNQLKDIQATLVDGKFPAEADSNPKGQEATAELLRVGLLWSDLVLERYAEVSLKGLDNENRLYK